MHLLLDTDAIANGEEFLQLEGLAPVCADEHTLSINTYIKK